MKTREELEAMVAEELKKYLDTESKKILDDIKEDHDKAIGLVNTINNLWMIGMGVLAVVAIICQRKSYRNGLNAGYTMGKNGGVMAGYKDAMKIMRWRS